MSAPWIGLCAAVYLAVAVVLACRARNFSRSFSTMFFIGWACALWPVTLLLQGAMTWWEEA